MNSCASGALTVAMVLSAVTPARAERRGQAHADVGLSVIHVGYELPIRDRFAISATAGIFGSYFLPWFDLGDRVIGVGAGLRATRFSRPDSRGYYVAPYVRGQLVYGDVAGASGDGLGFSAGFFVGRVLALTSKLDLRLGLGAQYIHHHIESDTARSDTGTPFIALDALLGYRL